MATCYRHPDRETGVSCSSCGRPICPDCMTPTPVGMRCPECAQQRTKVVRGPSGGASGFQQSPATYVLIALNVVAFLAQIGTGSGGISGTSGSVALDFGLAGAPVAEGEWYRLVTGGFLHAGLFHIGLNMAALFIVGRVLEPGIGTPRFVALYVASLLAGAAGALALTDPYQLTVGASGAIFGIFGATAVIAYGRGMGAVASEIGFLIVLNLVISFTVPGISIGGHLGGLIGGAICAAGIVAGERGMLGPNRRFAEFAVMGIVAVVSVVGALAVA
ncbi:MAG TPA: rhomboid family intramembrane serine protease [Solirubrobacterales bacterium]|nr:rhomboid family intramembrane serine protease [Solirubrobacterales bacterium]